MTEQPPQPDNPWAAPAPGTTPPTDPSGYYTPPAGTPGYAVPQWGQLNQPAIPVPPERLASPGRRLGGALLSALLVIVTLVIGYLIWAIVCWTKSTTPAKRLLGMQVVNARTGAPATFGEMVMRQVVWQIVLSIGSSVTFGILGIVDAFFTFSGTRQRLLDRMANTLVVRV